MAVVPLTFVLAYYADLVRNPHYFAMNFFHFYLE